MENRNSYPPVGYENNYFNLTQEASDKILEIVRTKQGRITLFALRDTWDEDTSDVTEQVKDGTVELTIDNGAGKRKMYPIDFFDNNGYVNILFVDDYGDNVQIYTDKMEDKIIYKIADFLVKTFGDPSETEEDFKISINWSVEDVLAQAEQDEVEITAQEAKEILQWIDNKHDASIGVNWDVISVYIGMYLDEAKPKEPFERFIYNDQVYLVRDADGYLVAGYDLRDVLIDKATSLPKSLHEQFVDNDIGYYASDAEMQLPAEELKKIIDNTGER